MPECQSRSAFRRRIADGAGRSARQVQVDLVSANQQESLIDLLCELNCFYRPNGPASREDVREHAAQNLLSRDAPHRLVVAARPDNTVIGLAAVALVFSLVEPELERRKQCQLKELFVSSSERGKGVGRALMRWVASYAIANGCNRIDWPVKAGNGRGIAFYQRLGAKPVAERLSYRLSQPYLDALARGSP